VNYLLFSKSTRKKIKGATIAQAIFFMFAAMLIGLLLSFQIQARALFIRSILLNNSNKNNSK
jgi:hypothetical protein